MNDGTVLVVLYPLASFIRTLRLKVLSAKHLHRTAFYRFITGFRGRRLGRRPPCPFELPDTILRQSFILGQTMIAFELLDHMLIICGVADLCPRLEGSVGYSLMADSVAKRDRVLKEALQCRVELVAYARSLLGNYTVAEDVVQEVFLVVMKKFDQFQEGTSMLAWCRCPPRADCTALRFWPRAACLVSRAKSSRRPQSHSASPPWTWPACPLIAIVRGDL